MNKLTKFITLLGTTLCCFSTGCSTKTNGKTYDAVVYCDRHWYSNYCCENCIKYTGSLNRDGWMIENVSVTGVNEYEINDKSNYTHWHYAVVYSQGK